MSDRIDRYVGCLLGQCLGDTLGFPVEGAPPGTCAAYVREVLSTDRLGHVGKGVFGFGQYTDDSQLARELLASLVHREAWDPDDYARRIACIFEEDRIVGRGKSTLRAAGRLRRGAHWRESGEPAPNAGNGTAMRAAPVGLLFRDRAARLAVAHEQGFMTHKDPRCSAGSIAIAESVACALEDDVDALVERVASAMQDHAPDFAADVRRLHDWVALPPDEAAVLIRKAGQAAGFPDNWYGISPFVVPSVLFSLYAFLRSPDDYWGAVTTAIAAGGDADTTAAMTGAIAGAALGRAALPDALIAKLNDRDTWREADLTELATRAAQLAPLSRDAG
ncbi:MAG: ADP-ribosylglycohydrolase family protein [Sandaracinaceae bacterium]